MPIAGAGLVAFNPSANLRFDAFLAKNFLSPATSFAALQTSYSFQGQAVSPVALPAGSRFYIPAHHRFGEETLSANPYVDSWMRSADKFIRNGELERAVAMANCPWEFASTGIDPLLAQYGWAVSTALFNSILPEGARMIGGRGVFRIWAPYAEALDLIVNEGKSGRLRSLKRDALGNYLASFMDIGPGTDYMYRIRYADGRVENLPDPFSRYQPCKDLGINGWSRLTDLGRFDWGDAKHLYRSFEDMRIYEMHVGLWTKEGSFNAIQNPSDWDYLVRRLRDELKINTVEIMPVHESPGEFNWGYDVVLPFGVYRSYGTPEELQMLVKKLHEAGISVIFDVVLNHLGKVMMKDGRWETFFGYFGDRNSEPTEWGPSLRFTVDEDLSRGHSVGAEGSMHNLSLATELVRMYVEDFGADGIRFDMTPFIGDQTGWRNKENNYAVLKFLKEMMGRIDPRVIFIAEDFRPKNGDLSFYAKTGIEHSWNFALTGALHNMLFPGRGEIGGYLSMDDLFNVAMYGTFRRFGYGEEIPPPMLNYFVSHDTKGNHEHDPVPLAADRERAMMAYAISVLARGAVMFFMGDEYGAGLAPAPGDADYFRKNEVRALENFHFFAKYPIFPEEDFLIRRGYSSIEEQNEKEPKRFASMKLLKELSPAWDVRIFEMWRSLMEARALSAALNSDDLLRRDPLYVRNDRGILIFERRLGDDVAVVGINMSDVDYREPGSAPPRVALSTGDYRLAFNSQDPKFGGRYPLELSQGDMTVHGAFIYLDVRMPPRSVLLFRNA